MEPRLSIPTASSPFQTILERSLRWDAYFYFWMICSEICSPEHEHPFDSQFRSSTSDPVSWGTEGTPFPFHQFFHVTSKPFTSRVHSNGIETEESFPGKLREFGNLEMENEMRRCLTCVAVVVVWIVWIWRVTQGPWCPSWNWASHVVVSWASAVRQRGRRGSLKEKNERIGLAKGVFINQKFPPRF